MKLITLNTWGGRAGKTLLLDFFKKHNDVDIFCLQEIFLTQFENFEVLLQEISEALPSHQSYFHPQYLDKYGLQTLVKKNLVVTDDGDLFVYKHRGYIPEAGVGNYARNIQYITLKLQGDPITIINFHGLWTKGINKTDTDDRINQSKKIVEFIECLSNDFILCGDFNLLPDTESMAILERTGLRNLIKEHGISSTRTSFYKNPEKYADYILISKGINVKEFKILPEEVSDHRALFLEI